MNKLLCLIEGGTLVLAASVPGHFLSFTLYVLNYVLGS